MRPCSDLLPGHRHCLHGHTEDCPDPGECALLPLEVDKGKIERKPTVLQHGSQKHD